MRKRNTIAVSDTDHQALVAIVTDRNSPQKHVWRAQIVLLTAEGRGTMELTCRTGTSKTSVWRWQERFRAEGVPGLLRDETRPPRIPPLGTAVEARVVAATQTAAPGEAPHWTSVAMTKQIGHQFFVEHLAQAWLAATAGTVSSNSPTIRGLPPTARHRRTLRRSAGACR